MEQEQNFDENENAGCDPAIKPASSPIPAGYSNLSYIRCVNNKWEWYDPSVAIEE